MHEMSQRTAIAPKRPVYLMGPPQTGHELTICFHSLNRIIRQNVKNGAISSYQPTRMEYVRHSP